MQLPQSVNAWNAFTSLERPGVRQYVDDLARDGRDLTLIRLRKHVVQHSFALAQKAHQSFDATLSCGLGTGRAPALQAPELGHVPNPGRNARLDRTQATIQGGLFAPIVAGICVPWLPLVGLSPAAAILGLSVGGAATAWVLHGNPRPGPFLDWLEGAAGMLTACGRASLSVYAAAVGALWGVATFLAEPANQRRGASRP